MQADSTTISHTHDEGRYVTATFSRPLAQGGTRLGWKPFMIFIIAQMVLYFKLHKVKEAKGGCVA